MLKSRQNDRRNSTERPAIGDQEWRPPGGYEDVDRWALENRTALEEYARRNEKHGTAAEQLERYLAAHPEALNGGHAAV
nr:hypothetical protein [uncultured Noviherbaspirillum sp.]